MNNKKDQQSDEKKGPWLAKIILAVIGLLGALITNIDRLYPVFVEIAGLKQPSAIVGEWNGVFREYDSTTKKEMISSEFVLFKERGSHISGMVKTSALGKVRDWTYSGVYKNSMLVMRYEHSDPEIKGVGTGVLEGDPKLGFLKGYWLGYDKGRKQLVACPYILTKENDLAQVVNKNKEWLERECYRYYRK
ncbi:MAG: hypothetical protein AABZ15_05415 [Nitrospirota bacterium]